MADLRVLLDPDDPARPRRAALTAADYTDRTPRAAGAMPVPPETVVLDVGGARQFRLTIVDPAESIAAGLQGLRLDSEISEDGGQTWRPHGIDVWRPGQQHTRKSPTFFVEERAMMPVRDRAGSVRLQPTTWPAGWRYRYHWRQAVPTPLGLTVEVDR